MFSVDEGLLEQCRSALQGDPRVFWLLGGAGSGKSAVARALHEGFGIDGCSRCSCGDLR